MLNVIYGINASGKTKVLLDMYSSCNKGNALTNLRPSIKFNEIPYSQERVDIVNSELEYQDIHVGSNGRLLSEELSLDILSVIEILCKSVDNVFIDEPDFGLNRNEAGIIVCMLERLGEVVPNLWVVTHNECMYKFKQKGVKYWNVREDATNDFVLVEVS